MGHSSSRDLERLHLVGKGFFGEVYKARCRKTGEIVAVKQINKALIKEFKLEDQLVRETEILGQLTGENVAPHPNIVRLLDSWADEGMYVSANLFERLRAETRFPEERAAKYFIGVVSALEHLHARKIMHRDIKPENILLTEEDVVKLADFGWSNVLQEAESLKSTFCGTLDYLAPEMIRSQGHSFSVDLWSLGILLYELLSGKSPFGAASQEETCTRILKLDLRWYSSIREDARDLIENLLRVEPEKRLGLAKIARHPFIVRTDAAAEQHTATKAPSPITTVCKVKKGVDVEVRSLKTLLKKTEYEMGIVLKAKAQIESRVLDLTDELERKCCELRRERALREKLEGELAEGRRRERTAEPAKSGEPKSGESKWAGSGEEGAQQGGVGSPSPSREVERLRAALAAAERRAESAESKLRSSSSSVQQQSAAASDHIIGSSEISWCSARSKSQTSSSENACASLFAAGGGSLSIAGGGSLESWSTPSEVSLSLQGNKAAEDNETILSLHTDLDRRTVLDPGSGEKKSSFGAGAASSGGGNHKSSECGSPTLLAG